MATAKPEDGGVSSRRALLGGALALSGCRMASVKDDPRISSTFADSTSLTTTGNGDRGYWLQTLIRLAEPPLNALRNQKLKSLFPVKETKVNPTRPWRRENNRGEFAPLEVLGRVLAGIAPWLESSPSDPEEEKLRARYAEWARAGIAAATDPKSADFMNFTQDRQPVVDAAFLAHALIRAPKQLWAELDAKSQQNLIAALRSTRGNRMYFNNWLLFGAMIEVTLYRFGASDWDATRVEFALRQHQQWYKGDGIYGDGPELHWDYYNSYVIHPMLLDILESVRDAGGDWGLTLPAETARARRYAEILERLISPEGTFPVVGRSMTYRFGAFHLLAQMALRKQLPDRVSPAQVRCALTAVMQRCMEAKGTFDSKGWLTIGLCGDQPSLAEPYISRGSPYLCTAGLLPLGLPSEDEFWTGSAQPWTSKKIWSGTDIPPDYAL